MAVEIIAYWTKSLPILSVSLLPLKHQRHTLKGRQGIEIHLPQLLNELLIQHIVHGDGAIVHSRLLGARARGVYRVADGLGGLLHVGQHLAGALDDLIGKTRQLGHLDTVAVVGGAANDLTEERNGIPRFLAAMW